uniref:Ig-like domain-containing protein n=1 Tax=Xiphophorus maculatus TaxID=8083 RepID=A0A3B5PTM9_XIPMA
MSCVLNQDCILPCRFRNEITDMRWFLYKTSPLIVSYDHRGSSYSESFRSRASLFEDQISRGNGDLLLRGVKVDDEGEYECTAKINGSYYRHYSDLTVEAPVSDIRIHQDGNRITCSSEGIYPQPELTWSTEPPSNTTLQNRTTVHQTEEKLYDISSSLTGPDGSDRIYSCTIRTRRNQRRAILRQKSVIVSSRQTSLSCSASNGSASKLLWRFNHSQVIVSRSSQSRATVTEEWKLHVKSVSESGGLSLQDLSPQQGGIYICELSNEEETLVTSTFLKVEDRGGTKRHPGVSMVVVAAAAVILCVVLIRRSRNQKGQNTFLIDSKLNFFNQLCIMIFMTQIFLYLTGLQLYEEATR